MLNPSRERLPLGLPAPAAFPGVSAYPLPAADMTSSGGSAAWPAAEPTRDHLHRTHDRTIHHSGADKPGAGANRLGAILSPDALSPAESEIAITEYRVTMGHVSVSVECSSSAEAIRLARTRLCVELPRLWDVIRTMDAARFNVIVVK